MALPEQLSIVKTRLSSKANLSPRERALLSELNALDEIVTSKYIAEAHVTKLTGPAGNVCGCCGQSL